MYSQPLPLFGPAAPKPQRADLEGWRYDDAALLHDEKNPGTWRKARVIGVSPRSHILTLREGERIVTLQMPEFKHKLRRPTL